VIYNNDRPHAELVEGDYILDIRRLRPHF
jgi:hypothetical protein